MSEDKRTIEEMSLEELKKLLKEAQDYRPLPKPSSPEEWDKICYIGRIGTAIINKEKVDLKRLFEAVDEFLEYPGQSNRRQRMMLCMVNAAKQQEWKLNVWDKHEAIPDEYRNQLLDQMMGK